MIPKWDSYTALGWLGMIAVPLAPAFFFAWDVFIEVQALTAGLVWLSVPVASLSAAGLEVVGILSGHTSMEFWKRRDKERAIIAAVIMVLYTGIGMYQLRATTGAIMFLIAPMVYILVALRHSLGEEKTTEKQQAIHGRRVEAQEREHRQRLEAAQLKLKHEENLAKINAKATAVNHPATVDKIDKVTHKTKTIENLTAAQRRIYEAIQAAPDANYTEIGATLGISRQAVSKQAKQMNGVIKGLQ